MLFFFWIKISVATYRVGGTQVDAQLIADAKKELQSKGMRNPVFRYHESYNEGPGRVMQDSEKLQERYPEAGMYGADWVSVTDESDESMKQIDKEERLKNFEKELVKEFSKLPLEKKAIRMKKQKEFEDINNTR